MTDFFSHSVSERLQQAVELIGQAGKMALRAFQQISPEQIQYKGPQDFLTQTDTEIEIYLKQQLRQHFPMDEVLGEETGGELSDSMWVLDPIDGTANFARGIPHFCLALAYLLQGKTQFGIILDPCHQDLYIAQLGRGATLNGRPVRVSATETFSVASLELGWSARIANARYLSLLDGLMRAGGNVRRGACGALGLAWVATGRTDAYLELHMNPWDCLAGMLLVSEAGGAINDYLAAGGLERGGKVVVSNRALAGQIGHIADVPLKISHD
ncbi:inositol monophosphatase [Affinibrenneria salicis]|uniref:Inositol-1-monophosphatase n=1 Tax=Affinibrenneria salicis TaxID=2590031 RepID=A0A5J5FYB6_9GAMM|nr:inositol monophosphatase [Affinibrenneria salicis]KAA8998054.1 inositol monophosphatase [Affinibrenneria salicis]